MIPVVESPNSPGAEVPMITYAGAVAIHCSEEWMTSRYLVDGFEYPVSFIRNMK